MCRLAAVLTLFAALTGCADADQDIDAELKSKTGIVDPSVARAPVPQGAIVLAPFAGRFAPQTRLGFTAGDQWEPALAADRLGHVYLLYPQYGGVPGCPSCPSPTMIFQMSSDGGTTWGPPRVLAAPGSGQWDAQIAVEPLGGRTVYAAWLQNNKSDTVVARSDDFGASFRLTVANHTNAGTDKDILAVRGDDVYVGYEHQQQVFVASSHDGASSFTEVGVNQNGKNGVSLAGGAAIDPAGRVFYAWSGYEQSGGAKGKVHLYVSRSTDGGRSWSLNELALSAAPPNCAAYLCGWAYLGAQITMTADDAGKLYALWNAGTVAGGPERIYFSSSADAGLTWKSARDLSAAPLGAAHAFPAIVAGAAGDVRVGWMDARVGVLWNVYTRRSSDGGATWSAETDVSTYVPGYDYIQPGGFAFPFGDYFEMAIDGAGATHLVWGEGRNYDTPGSIWYTHD